jgi:hypothetical protein
MTFQSYVNWKEKSQEYDPSYCEEHNPCGKEDTISNNYTKAPKRGQVQIPVPGFRGIGLETAGEGILCPSPLSLHHSKCNNMLQTICELTTAASSHTL